MTTIYVEEGKYIEFLGLANNLLIIQLFSKFGFRYMGSSATQEFFDIPGREDLMLVFETDRMKDRPENQYPFVVNGKGELATAFKIFWAKKNEEGGVPNNLVAFGNEMVANFLPEKIKGEIGDGSGAESQFLRYMVGASLLAKKTERLGVVEIKKQLSSDKPIIIFPTGKFPDRESREGVAISQMIDSVWQTVLAVIDKTGVSIGGINLKFGMDAEGKIFLTGGFLTPASAGYRTKKVSKLLFERGVVFKLMSRFGINKEFDFSDDVYRRISKFFETITEMSLMEFQRDVMKIEKKDYQRKNRPWWNNDAKWAK